MERDAMDALLEPARQSRIEAVVRKMISVGGRISRMEAAEIVHLSVDRFSHCFTRVMGSCFRTVRARIRVLALASTLREQLKDAGLKAWMAVSGFAGWSPLSRAFRRETDCTPLSFVERYPT